AQRTNAPGRTTRKSPSRYLTSASPGIGEDRSVRLSKWTSVAVGQWLTTAHTFTNIIIPLRGRNPPWRRKKRRADLPSARRYLSDAIASTAREVASFKLLRRRRANHQPQRWGCHRHQW